ncbi:similar to Kazachstania africana KAFR_0G03280 hypothetical protein [Maudiozyma barnettii]|uniref:Uncharacterized protein n=1 Tax=Maudiozyma barnettii TaxID=61262 RepID=A0A8H2VKD8_9SACH|nr:uncharacterized protein KABA2_13S00352 [Kazachstania barnettii]CAB4256981.1 similar to Kazachstania africana KAFR_0G03280 hypothetical protein [Kazachstania barnettii]CAD1779352.1 similar to Kazachstania africana KAFR_0G03280 hypothetical protein [Kazachstania barnettii]
MSRPSAKNIKNLDNLFSVFKKSIPDLSLEYNTFLPHLYPTEQYTHRTEFRSLARQLISTQIFSYNSRLFRRSKYDVNGSDFNFMSKLPGGTNAFDLINPRTSKHTSQEILIQRFITDNNLNGISNIPIPESRLPKRIRRKFDRLTVLSILGLLITKEPTASEIIINDRVLQLKGNSK